MSKRDKVIERLRQNPKTVRFEDVDSLLLSFGFEKRQKGSHATYSLEKHRPITIPLRRPYILPVYVKHVLQILDEMDEETKDA